MEIPQRKVFPAAVSEKFESKEWTYRSHYRCHGWHVILRVEREWVSMGCLPSHMLAFMLKCSC